MASRDGTTNILRGLNFFFSGSFIGIFYFSFFLFFLCRRQKNLLEIDSPSIRQTLLVEGITAYNSQSWDGVIAKYIWWLVLSFRFFKAISPALEPMHLSCRYCRNVVYTIKVCNGDGAGRTDRARKRRGEAEGPLALERELGRKRGKARLLSLAQCRRPGTCFQEHSGSAEDASIDDRESGIVGAHLLIG